MHASIVMKFVQIAFNVHQTIYKTTMELAQNAVKIVKHAPLQHQHVHHALMAIIFLEIHAYNVTQIA